MGSVYPRGRKLWLKFKGPSGWEQHATDYVVGQEGLARATLDQIETRLEAGEVVLGEIGQVTVGDYYRAWIREREAEIQTWKNDEFVFRLHVLPALEKRRIDAVRPADLVALVKGWRGVMAPKSVHNAYSTVSAFFRDACIGSLIATSPCILTKRQLGSKEPKDPEFRAKAVYVRDEVERLISDDRISQDRRVLYALQGLGGLRHGEAAGLRFRNCSTPAEPLSMVYVAFSYDRPYPKGGRCRPVPVHPTLAAVLAEWKLDGWAKMMGRQPTPDDLVLPIPLGDKNAGELRTRQYSGDRFRLDLALLNMRHRRGHDLRRTFISLTRSDGARSDILRRVTHKPPPEVFEGYTTFEWPVVCAEVLKLKISRRTDDAEVFAISRASGNVEGGFGTVLGTVETQPLVTLRKTTLALPGLEPGCLATADFESAASTNFAKGPSSTGLPSSTSPCPGLCAFSPCSTCCSPSPPVSSPPW